MESLISPNAGPPVSHEPQVSSGERGTIKLDQPVGSRLSWNWYDGVLRLDVEGEICAWVVRRIESLLIGLLNDLRPWAIVADLSGVTFVDASGVNLMVQVQQLAAARGASLTLESPSCAVRRLLALCDLDRDFRVS